VLAGVALSTTLARLENKTKNGQERCSCSCVGGGGGHPDTDTHSHTHTLTHTHSLMHTPTHLLTHSLTHHLHLLECNRPFAVVPCCVFASRFPRVLDGRPVTEYEDFVSYLERKATDSSPQRAELDLAGRKLVLFTR
jgi:hypothetical protein